MKTGSGKNDKYLFEGKLLIYKVITCCSLVAIYRMENVFVLEGKARLTTYSF
ncbi:MAG: hypothetical protein QM654_12455 [Dysgonamonadaceae bacterium]